MNGYCWCLVDILSRTLEPGEREAVLGDLAESGETGSQALGEVLGLVARRQADSWKDWRPWLTLGGFIIPLGMLLSIASRFAADQDAPYFWLYANNWDWALLKDAGFWHQFAESAMFVAASCLTLVCWSWTAGFVLGSQARSVLRVYRVLFCAMLAAGVFVLAPRYFDYLLRDLPRRLSDSPDDQDWLAFYKMMFPLIAQAALVAVPFCGGMHRGADLRRFQPLLRLVLLGAAIASLTALAIQTPGVIFFLKAFWLRRESQAWPIHLLQIFVYWPVAYVAALTLGQRRKRRLQQPSFGEDS
jgi:hypothetical protein